MVLFEVQRKLVKTSKNPGIAKKNKGKLIILSKCVAFNIKKLRFIKEQEAVGLLSFSEIKTPSSKISLVGPLLF